MRKKLEQQDKKVNITLSISPIIMEKVNELKNNKSKYVEKLILKDLIKNNYFSEDIEI